MPRENERKKAAVRERLSGKGQTNNSGQSGLRTRNLIFLLAVLAAVTVYYIVVAQGSPQMRFSAEARTLGFYGSKNTSAVFSFDTIEAIELVEADAVEYGEAIDGGTLMGGIHYGLWQSETFGTYQAYLRDRFPACIVVRDAEKTAIFNADNRESTRSLYEQLRAFWREELKK